MGALPIVALRVRGTDAPDSGDSCCTFVWQCQPPASCLVWHLMWLRLPLRAPRSSGLSGPLLDDLLVVVRVHDEGGVLSLLYDVRKAHGRSPIIRSEWCSPACQVGLCSGYVSSPQTQEREGGDHSTSARRRAIA